MVKKKSQSKNKIARIDIEIYKLGNVFIGHTQSKTTIFEMTMNSILLKLTNNEHKIKVKGHYHINTLRYNWC